MNIESRRRRRRRRRRKRRTTMMIRWKVSKRSMRRTGGYIVYIRSISLLNKEIYRGDVFGPDNFDSIEGVKDLPQLGYLLVENVDLAGDLRWLYACAQAGPRLYYSPSHYIWAASRRRECLRLK
jgi:hypothetical protein